MRDQRKRLTIPSTELNQRRSPLLRLPPELRNRIYAYSCDHVEIIYSVMNPPHTDLEHCQIRMKRDGDTLRFVCKQVRHEAKPYANSYQHLTCDTSLYDLTCADASLKQDRCLVRYIDITGKGVPKALMVSLMQYHSCRRFAGRSQT